MRELQLTDEQYFALESIVVNYVISKASGIEPCTNKDRQDTLVHDAVSGIKSIADAKIMGTTAIDAAYEVYMKSSEISE